MEKEGLAIVEACKHFLPYLVGKKFCVVTDNRALQYHYNKDPTTGRLARWLDALRDLYFEVRHRPGTPQMEMQTDYRDKLGQMRTLFRRRGGCQEAPILLAEI